MHVPRDMVDLFLGLTCVWDRKREPTFNRIPISSYPCNTPHHACFYYLSHYPPVITPSSGLVYLVSHKKVGQLNFFLTSPLSSKRCKVLLEASVSRWYDELSYPLSTVLFQDSLVLGSPVRLSINYKTHTGPSDDAIRMWILCAWSLARRTHPESLLVLDV